MFSSIWNPKKFSSSLNPLPESPLKFNSINDLGDTRWNRRQHTYFFTLCPHFYTYWNQLKKFRKFWDVLSSGSHETGGTAKKVTASDSAKPGHHMHIFFFDSGVTGTRRNGDKEWKSMYVCVCMWRFFVGVYFTLYLQGPKSLLAQIWNGDFYIWGIDAIKFLWRSREGAEG